MAVVRARSSPPYALIIFVFLWVVSTALAVVFYMQNEKTGKLLEDSDKAKTRLARANESRVVDTILEGKTTESAIAAASRQIDSLRLLIDAGKVPTSDLINPTEGVVAKYLASINQKDKPLLSVVNELDTQLKARTSELAQTQQLAKDEQAKYSAAYADHVKALASKSDSIGQSANDVNKLQGELSAANQEKTALTTRYERDITALKDKSEVEKRELSLQIEQLKNDIVKAKNRIDQLTTQIANLRPQGPNNVGREPDGSIVRAASGTNEIYINLGKRDRVIPGQTFAVYDPKLGIRWNKDDAEARGKGGLEVLEVGENESLARITGLEKGQRFQVGDLIANPVYNQDKNRKFHFVVFGDFDLDGDAQTSSSERERVVRMIQSWGGVVDDSLSTQTDFLVIGARPALPANKGDDAAESGSVYATRLTSQLTYDKLVIEAKASSVPVLNANRFLGMIGYYNTTIVKH